MCSEDFYRELKALGVTHHAARTIKRYLEHVLFPLVEFSGKSVLDVGGGRGLCSFYAVFSGASRADNVEPLLAGSESEAIAAFERTRLALATPKATLINETIQDYLKHCVMYDVIVLHDSINHLDEETYQRLHDDSDAERAYIEMFKRMAARHNPGGPLIVTDCARRNAFGDLGLRSPFAPSIDWHLHQNPQLVARVLKAAGYEDIYWKWTPLKRLGRLGYILAELGSVPSYFMQSHFVLFATRAT